MASKQQKFICLNLGSPRSRCQDSWVLVRTLFLVVDSELLVVSSHGREQNRGGKPFCDTYKGTIPIHAGKDFFPELL